MSARYSYQPTLESQIRILVLSPGEHHESLYGRLDVVELDDSVDYSAISYTWGAPIFNIPLTLVHPQGVVMVTESLHGALRRFRSATEEVRLWADAVCIDQSNTNERNHQVSIMTRVFDQALRVHVWLGEQSGDTTVAYWMALTLRDHFLNCPIDMPNRATWTIVSHFLNAKYIGRPRSCSCCGTSAGSYVGTSSFADSLHALLRLLERPFFARLWVVQELASKYTQHGFVLSFYCGPHKISGATLRNAVMVCDHIVSRYNGPVLLVPQTPSTPVFATFEYLNQGPDVLIKALMATRDLKCADPRDRVFAIRALLSTKPIEQLLPDYNLPVEELWLRLAAHLVTAPASHGGLDASFILALVGAQEAGPRIEALPSWVPDFSRLKRAARNKQRFYGYECDAVNELAPRVGGANIFLASQDSQDPKLLRLRGKVIDTVSAILPESQYPKAARSPAPLAEYWTYIRSTLIPWYCKCYSFLAAELGFMHNWHDDFAVILRQGTNRMPRSGPSWEESEHVFVEACEELSFDHPLVDAKEMHADLGVLLAWRMTHAYYLDQRRVLASSERKRVCWAPEEAKEGDIIIAFKGAPFPFIVRRRADGCFTVLGDAYVYSIMRGEAWPDDPIEAVDIVLA